MKPFRLIASLGCGILFGLGLVISGMSNPAKVLAFLDFFGAWDPSLAAVMAGAIPVTALFYWVARRRALDVSGAAFPNPPAQAIDRRLVLGAATFGIGWGLVGFCPGPAIAALALDWRPILVVAAMAVGFDVARRLRPAPTNLARDAVSGSVSP